MKRKWIIPVTAVLLLLLIPIPTGTYKDGGTKTYAALTYKIVDWNHMYDDSVYNNTKVYPFPMNFMSLNSLWEREKKIFDKSGIESDSPTKKQNDFFFSLKWDCYGISSYDSKTGKLVKTTDTTHPEDYVSTYKLTADEYTRIYNLISDLNVASYPDIYNPHIDGLCSSPSMTLILSVHTNTLDKTIKAENIAWTFESSNKKGQKFLSVCKAIRDILVETEEWKALPDYEFYYD